MTDKIQIKQKCLMQVTSLNAD